MRRVNSPANKRAKRTPTSAERERKFSRPSRRLDVIGRSSADSYFGSASSATISGSSRKGAMRKSCFIARRTAARPLAGIPRTECGRAGRGFANQRQRHLAIAEQQGPRNGAETPIVEQIVAIRMPHRLRNHATGGPRLVDATEPEQGPRFDVAQPTIRRGAGLPLPDLSERSTVVQTGRLKYFRRHRAARRRAAPLASMK